MRNLSGPATVNREQTLYAIADPKIVRRQREVLICESGNLLNIRDELPCMALTSDKQRENDCFI